MICKTLPDGRVVWRNEKEVTRGHLFPSLCPSPSPDPGPVLELTLTLTPQSGQPLVLVVTSLTR